MKKLSKSEITIVQLDPHSIIVGAHENNGYVCWTKILLSDLPNDLVDMDDLERVGINLVHG